MIRQWIVGLFIGTVLIGVTSPWFVRSYVPRVTVSLRRVPVLQPGASYRWRSEGYATTSIGEWGMPGQTNYLKSNTSETILAFWGDSQAEGVCVTDDSKIPAVVFQASDEETLVLPFARSGDDCNDWISQIEVLGSEISRSDSGPATKIDAHVFLLVEWSDWCIDINDSIETENSVVNRASSSLPAFVIQAGRNVLTTGEGNEPRELRFRPGPVKADTVESRQSPNATESDGNDDLTEKTRKLTQQLTRLRETSPVPCVFVYAPMVPSIVDGAILVEDPNEDLFQEFERLCRGLGFVVIDVRNEMSDSANQHRWPRGFHNGQFGVGHYNAIGNRIIGEAINRRINGDPIARSGPVQNLNADRAKD